MEVYDSDKDITLEYKEDLLSPKETKAQEANLDMSYAGWSVDTPNIDELPNDQFAIARRRGFGGSDSSVLLGVNPYTTVEELIDQKARDHLTEEEKATGDKVAVRKGRDFKSILGYTL